MVALAFASSCQQEEAEPNPPQPAEVTISASAAETKTAMDGNSVVWEDGDRIAIVFTHPSQPAHVGNFSTQIEGGRAVTAEFKGKISPDVIGEGEYDEMGYAVYPSDAVAADGSVDFTVPSQQTPRADGTFASGFNLSSATVSLSDLREDGRAEANFRNALSVIRLTPAADVTQVTITGTAPFAGKAPFVVDSEDDGRLVIDTQAEWAESDKDMSVTIRPAEGMECFDGNTAVNVLVLPGTHSGLFVTVRFKDYGDYQKSARSEFVFAPSKFYSLNLKMDSEKLIEEISGSLGSVEDELDDLEDRLSQMETAAEKISHLVDQIQSVALMTEYLDNAVYAGYVQQMYSKLKKDIELTYVVRPAKAMKLLLDLCKEEGNLSEVLSVKVSDRAGSLSTLAVKDAVLDGDILTVTAAPLWDSFYEGTASVPVALQISDGNTELLSDFANVFSKQGAMLKISKTRDVPVLKGASLTMSFQYGGPDMDACRLSVSSAGFASAPTVSANDGTGVLYAYFGEGDDLSGKNVTVTLACGDETDSQTITFADGGRFEAVTSGDVDYVGGEVTLDVLQNDFGSYRILFDGNSWIYPTNNGNNSRLTVNYNNGAARTASATFSVSNGSDISYSKTLTITQKAYGSQVDESRYHQSKSQTVLQNATAGYVPLNVVIIGDGYQKKDLQKGGKFERSADSAMEAFFGVEPFKSFRDRFRVVMVAYESVDEGLTLEGVDNKNTYFKSLYKGGGNTYVNLQGADYSSVVNVVKNDLGWSDDATYYRTIVLMLINTSEGIGSNAAVYRAAYGNVSVTGEPYASMALAMVTANNDQTSNLIRHEAGGHAFGRLGDEYPTKQWGSDVNGFHDIGWYRNITVDRNVWNWDRFIGLSGYEDVTYYQPNSSYWCPIDHTIHNSIMYNNMNRFNAPCRQIIYERIIRQTEGSDAYSWDNFLEYDRRNVGQ